jgi:hypothetical protein
VTDSGFKILLAIDEYKKQAKKDKISDEEIKIELLKILDLSGFKFYR